MFLLYDLAFLIITIAYLPAMLFKRKLHGGLKMRLGILPPGLPEQRPFWIHAVSVGEIIAMKGLIDLLRRKNPGVPLVISTVTPTGNKIAREIAAKGDAVIYLPLDFSWICRRVVNTIRPAKFIIAETEIWPNLITSLYKNNVPIIVVNGRISDRSFRGYQRAKFFLAAIFRKIALFCVQSKTDETRLLKLGVGPDHIRVTGNMKFDFKIDTKKDYSGYRRKLGMKETETLFVAASTHDPEEEIVVEAFKDVSSEFPGLRLLLAPRHPQRSSDIEKIIQRNGFAAARLSALRDISSLGTNGKTIFILDTIGELVSYYAVADVVFVGGSLMPKGGHNILEPAFFGKPVLFGPHMFNFRDIADLFLANQAALMVENGAQLREGVKSLLENKARAQELGRRARELISRNQGATLRNYECVMRMGV